MQIIDNGENPYQIERDANGNPITYLDDSTVSQDQQLVLLIVLREVYYYSYFKCYSFR